MACRGPTRWRDGDKESVCTSVRRISAVHSQTGIRGVAKSAKSVPIFVSRGPELIIVAVRPTNLKSEQLQ